MSATAAELKIREQHVTEVPDFGRLAKLYRWMEWLSFGPFLWRSRCTFLDRMRSQRRALVIGDGDGRFTARLLRENRRIRIDALDASARMVSELERRAKPHQARLHTEVTDARLFEPAKHNFDLVVTHFFLDCLRTDEVARLAARLRRNVADDAIWVVSEFAEPQGWYGRVVARPLIAALYWAFGQLTGLNIRRLPEYSAALSDAGWSQTNRSGWGVCLSANCGNQNPFLEVFGRNAYYAFNQRGILRRLYCSEVSWSHTPPRPISSP